MWHTPQLHTLYFVNDRSKGGQFTSFVDWQHVYFSAKQPFLPETHHKSSSPCDASAVWPPHCHLYQTSHPLVQCCLIDAIAADGWAAPVWPKSRVTCGTACFRLYMYTFNAFSGILLSVGTAHRVLPKFTVACLSTEGAGNSRSWGNCYLANRDQ